MRRYSAFRPWRLRPRASTGVFPFVIAFVLIVSACKSTSRHTTDPQLRQIDELIAKSLPPGTPAAQVNFFLNSRGYPQEDSHQAHVLIATIEHVDTETLQPAAARVTFRFDNNDKLVTYELTAVAPSTVH